LVFLGLVLAASNAHAQGDGPRVQLLSPVGANVLAPTYLDLSSNFNFAQDILVEGADITSRVGVATYIRFFRIGDRFAQVWVNPIWGSVGGAVDVDQTTIHVPSVSGLADPYLAMRVGLVGAPALTPAEFVKHTQRFQLHALVGAYVPVGDYDSNRPLNLGTNRWAIRLGLPMVVPFGKPGGMTYLEINPGAVFYTTNSDPFGADRRTQDPLFIVESHLSHDFTPTFWGSVDLRYQTGGETTTDGVADDNRIGQLGGGVSLGYWFNRSLGLQASYGDIIAKNDDSSGSLLRVRLSWIF
jgi:hypothetical protein